MAYVVGYVIQVLRNIIQNKTGTTVNSLCGHLAKVLLSRLKDNPTPSIITTMSKCLDLENILGDEESEEVKVERDRNMKILCRAAKIDEDNTDKILTQYNMFKDRLKAVVQCSEDDELVKRFDIYLFKTHKCSKECGRSCPDIDKVIMPRIPKLFKIVHLFYKEPSLYLGLEEFLALFLKCLVKTHAEGCAESMGNLVDMHCDKRRGRMDLEDIGKEAAIHWNCPPLAKADGLGTRSLDKLFGQGK